MTTRQAVWNALNVPELTDQLPGGLRAGGSLTGPPTKRPFAVYRMNVTNPSLRGDDDVEARDETVEVWVHDDPGSYVRIEAILETVEALLKASAALRCRYNAESAELADDEMKTIVKNISLTCSERS